MIAVNAIFAVIRCQCSGAGTRVLTILTDLTDIRPHDAAAPALPTFEEAVRIATERGLNRPPRIGFVKQLGVTEYVPVCERVVLNSGDEVDALATSMLL